MIQRSINILFKCKASRLALVASVLTLNACAQCYPVKMNAPGLSGVKAATVVFDETEVRDLVPQQVVCESVPETVEIQYYTDNSGEFKLAKGPVYVSRNMPDGFLENPARRIEFYVDKEGNASVRFRMQLSRLTTKLLAHSETGTEREQRLQDEKLWTGIIHGEVSLVNDALKNGASANQPWMDSAYGSVSEESSQYVVYKAAMRSRNPEILDAVLSAGAMKLDESITTNLWFRFGELGAKHEYVGNSLARVLLKHGANPNGGRRIPFSWNTTDWRNRPGMPEYADLKAPPTDRLIYLAAKMGDTDFVKLLLEFGAEINFRLPASREPPDWWKDGEWFTDWVKREASPEVKAIILPD